MNNKESNKSMSCDPYTAVWLSHSSISDFLSCERLYFLKNLFKNPNTRRKINVVSPYLSLGVAVHNVLERLKNISTSEREKEIKENLLNNFKEEWQKNKGKKGGFRNEEEEESFYERGEEMIKKVIKNPKHLLNKIIQEKYFWDRDLHKGFNPHYFFSEEENLILNGAIDWIEFLEEENAMRIIDFKTGRNDEDDDSFQLPIYYLLISNLDKKKKYKVKEVAYWYLDQENKKENQNKNEKAHEEFHIIEIDEKKLDDIKKVETEILKIGKRIKKAREERFISQDWVCPNEKIKGEGCRYCRDFEKVFKYLSDKNQDNFEKEINLDEDLDKVEYVGISDYKQDLFFIK